MCARAFLSVSVEVGGVGSLLPLRVLGIELRAAGLHRKISDLLSRPPALHTNSLRQDGTILAQCNTSVL